MRWCPDCGGYGFDIHRVVYPRPGYDNLRRNRAGWHPQCRTCCGLGRVSDS